MYWPVADFEIGMNEINSLTEWVPFDEFRSIQGVDGSGVSNPGRIHRGGG